VPTSEESGDEARYRIGALPIVTVMLKPGDKAPDFTLLDQHGEKFKLSQSLKRTKASHLVYFYPKVSTP
jgi:peroxiredoxin